MREPTRDQLIEAAGAAIAAYYGHETPALLAGREAVDAVLALQNAARQLEIPAHTARPGNSLVGGDRCAVCQGLIRGKPTRMSAGKLVWQFWHVDAQGRSTETETDR